MFLPLGLFLKLKKFPIITVLLILACSLMSLNSFFNKENNSNFFKEHLDSEEYIAAKNIIITQYCISKDMNKEFCIDLGIGKNKKSKNVKNEEMEKPDWMFTNETKKKKSKENIGKLVVEAFGQIGLITEVQEELVDYLDESSILSHLDSYDSFSKIHNVIMDKKSDYNKKKNLLASGNINITSIFTAMFTHAGIIHLLSNMLMLLVFGIYVEARVGSGIYLLTYLVSGFVSLGGYSYFTSPLLHVVGASGNVFAVMGMFYFFFRDKRMKFFLFYLSSKVISIPVKRNFFFLFILLELVLLVTGGTNIAHGAHILGLIFGILVAWFWEKKKNIPRSFLYENEYKCWLGLSQGDPISERIIYSEKALEYNPFNAMLRNKILNDIIEESHFDKEILKNNKEFCEEQLCIFMKNSFEKNKENTVKLLRNISMILQYTKILRFLTVDDIIELLDTSIQEKELFVSLKLINYICEKYPNLSQIDDFIKTGESIMDNLDISEDKINYLFKNSKSIKFSNFIENYINFEEA